MEYIWTDGYVKDLALANRKVDNEVLYSVCAVEASYNKEETLALYSMVREVIQRDYRRF
jgi:hypothetical protein